MELDRHDRHLLRLVQEDSGRTAEQLARHVALSPSAIQRRLRRLREQGVIAREIAILDFAKLDRSALYLVSLEVERERPELLSQLRKWLASQEHVQQAFYVTGDTDFVLVVTAPDTETYDALMARMVSENANIRRFTTNVVLSPVKQGLSIPIPTGQD